MRRLLRPLFLVFMLIGLLGSMGAYWKTVMRPSINKVPQEEDTDEEGGSSELILDLDVEPGLPQHPMQLVERNAGPQPPPVHEPVQVPPPEQAVVPRVIIVWRPPCRGPDEEPALA